MSTRLSSPIGAFALALWYLRASTNVVFVVLELHHEWARRDSNREHDSVEDSGGTTILLSPGLSADLTPNLSAFWAMPIPIYQNLGGQHEELTYEVIAGLSWHF
jgi:hypothetical protein